VVITGGADVHPAQYGQDPHGSVEAADDDRDLADLALARQAWVTPRPSSSRVLRRLDAAG